MSELQRETLFRSADFQLRDDDGGGMPTMRINFARFNEWTEIRDIFEGHFLERFAPGAFKKTFAERGDKIRVLFQHGQDPQVGSKPLGSITELREDKNGAYAEVELLDTDYVRELLPGIRAGLYGASMAFRPVRSEDIDDPGASDHNPAGIREVTVKESALREFGPVTFPAYENTSAGVRSLTGDLIIDRLARVAPDTLRQMINEKGSDMTKKLQLEISGDADAVLRVTSTETESKEEQEPAAEATPAPRLVRVGDRYLPLKAA